MPFNRWDKYVGTSLDLPNMHFLLSYFLSVRPYCYCLSYDFRRCCLFFVLVNFAVGFNPARDKAISSQVHHHEHSRC